MINRAPIPFFCKLLVALLYLTTSRGTQIQNDSCNMCKFWKAQRFYYSQFSKHAKISKFPGVHHILHGLKTFFILTVHVAKRIVKFNAL